MKRKLYTAYDLKTNCKLKQFNQNIETKLRIYYSSFQTINQNDFL